MKKLLGIFLLLQVLWIPNVYAEELPTISVGSFDAYIGEEITVPITIQNNPGCSYLGVKIYYDLNQLEYVNSKLKGLKNADMKDIVRSNDMITLYAMAIDEGKYMKDQGTIAEITFHVKEDATTSTLRIEVTDFGGEDLVDYQFKQVEGVIRIADKKNLYSKDDLTQLVPPTTEGEVIWKSDDEKVATIDEQGNITFSGEGSTTVTGTDSDGNIVLEKEYKVVADKKENPKDKENKNKTKQNEHKKNELFIYTLISLGILSIIIVILLIARFSFKKKKSKENTD